MEPKVPIEREEAARRFDKAARHMTFAVVPFAAIAIVDLATGVVTDEPRLDFGMLAIVAMSLWAAFSNRRLARQFRSDDFPPEPTPARWMAVVLSLLISLAFSAGVGYLIGGLVLAGVFPAVIAVLLACGIGLGFVRRRKAKAMT